MPRRHTAPNHTYATFAELKRQLDREWARAHGRPEPEPVRRGRGARPLTYREAVDRLAASGAAR